MVEPSSHSLGQQQGKGAAGLAVDEGCQSIALTPTHTHTPLLDPSPHTVDRQTMKGALILSLLAAPALAFVPHAPPTARKSVSVMSTPLPGLASSPGQPTVESWLLDNADPKLCE